MQPVSQKCPQCLGNVIPIGGGYGKCEYCGAVYQIGEVSGDVPAGIADEEPKDRVKPKKFFEEWGKSGAAARCNETYFGAKLPGKRENAARRYFDVPSDEEMYLANDTTIFGSGKKGFACCKSGIYINDEDNVKGYISWKDFKKSDLHIQQTSGARLRIDEYGFITQDKEILCDMLKDLQKRL